MTDDPLLAEKQQAFETLVALLQRRDEVYDATGTDPLESAGNVIKAAGMVRDELPPDEAATSSDVDPAEVFDGE